MNNQLRDQVKKLMLRCGIDAYGFCRVDDLPSNQSEIADILPGAISVIVIAVPHTRSAIASKNKQVGQYDTIHTYDEVARIANVVARKIESAGFGAVAVPAFIPIDMTPPKRGMKGAIDWRAAGVAAGLGCYGRSGLLVTPRYGSAVRIGGVVTTARFRPGKRLKENPCDGCMNCIELCPAGALREDGTIDKKKCGDSIFETGFRAWQAFLCRLAGAGPEEARELTTGQLSMDLWQNFMTGNYYSCFNCQSACAPVQRKPRKTVRS